MEQKENDLHVIYITKNCNLRCDYCYEGLNKSNEKISEETLIQHIDMILSERDPKENTRILFFGGEVFLNFNVLIAGLEHIKKKREEGYQISSCLTSNGTLITEEKMLKLFKYRFLSFEVSFDGREKTQNKYRKFKSGIGSFDILNKKCKILLKYFPFTTVRMVVSDANDLYEDVMFLADYGFKKFCIQGIKGNLTQFDQESYELFLKEVERIKENFKTRRLTKIESVVEPHIKKNKEIVSPVQEKEEEINKDKLYKYFLPNGEHVVQNPYNPFGFEHFTKGANAQANLNKKGE